MALRSIFNKNVQVLKKTLQFGPHFNHGLEVLPPYQLRNASFARELAVGLLNMKWVFPYPTIDTEEELLELNQLSDTVGRFFEEQVNSKQMDIDASFDDQVIQGLKDLGLFGLQIPSEYGGLGLNNVQYARVLEEVSRDGAIGVMLGAHQAIGLKGIILEGTEEQKRKYLPKLATGEWIAAFALTEAGSGSDASSIRTSAHLSDDGQHWVLNGEKIWITNGGIADIMTVFAKTTLPDVDGKKVEKVTGFIVERSFGGVVSGKPEDKLGIRASNTCTVSFEDTHVPIANVLGEVGAGFKLAMQILNSGRFSMGSGVAGQQKRMISVVSEYAHQRQQFGKKLADFELIQQKIFTMSMEAYAMESMAYMTAGQMDTLDDDGKPQDCSVEAAMVKIFSSESAWKNCSEILQIFGGSGYMRDYPFERMLRDCRILLIFEGTNEILRLYVALSSLQHAGKELKYRLRLLKRGSFRERMTSLMDTLREEFPSARPGVRALPNPSFGLTAERQTLTWLDPRLKPFGAMLEHSTQLYRQRVYQALKKHGKKIQDEQLVLEKLADVSIKIYAMTAVLSRCNKSLLLSLRNSDEELWIAISFLKKTYREVYLICETLSVAYTENYTALQTKVSKKLMDERRYLFSHPLDVVHNYKEHPLYLEQLEQLKALES